MSLNPVDEGSLAARRAAMDAIHVEDEVSVEDQGESWFFTFVPTGDVLGGGACVSVAKSDLRVLKVVRGQ